MSRVITREERQRIVDLYLSGLTIRAVAKELSTSTGTVMHQMRRAGVESRPRATDRCEFSDEEVVRRFREGEQIADIARSLEVSYGAISFRLRRNGVIDPPKPKDPNKHIDPAEVAELIAQGESASSIARRFRVAPPVIRGVMEHAGCGGDDVDQDAVVAYWCEFNSLASTGRKFGLSPQRTIDLLVKGGISENRLPRRTPVALVILAKRLYAEGVNLTEIAEVIGMSYFSARRYVYSD